MKVEELRKFIIEHQTEVEELKAEIIISKSKGVNCKEIVSYDDIIKTYYTSKTGVVKHIKYENKSKTFEVADFTNINDANIESYFQEVSNIVEAFLQDKQNSVISDIEKESSVKIRLSLKYTLTRDNQPYPDQVVSTKTECLCIGEDRVEYYQKACKQLRAHMENHDTVGSGWSLRSINALYVDQTKFDSPRGSRYIDLFRWIKNKHCVINPKNQDNKCFMWCVLAHLHPVDKDAHRVSKYQKYENELNFEGCTFPMMFKDIKKFEKKNDLIINVFGVDLIYEKIIPLLPSKKVATPENEHTIVNLLYIEEGDNCHYCYIKDLNKLMNKRDKHQKLFCARCHAFYYDRKKYLDHLADCGLNKPMENLLSKEKITKFENYQRTQKHRYIIYADFENNNEKIQEKAFEFNEKKKNTRNITKHIPSGYCIIVVDSFTKLIYDLKFYVGSGAAFEFNKYIIEITQKIMNNINIYDIKIRDLTPRENEEFKECKNCPICAVTFENDENIKCKDHDHWTGEYRGPLCNKCNLLKKKNNFIPVFFHNLKGYDAHNIIGDQESNEYLHKRNIQVKLIPSNTEKFISFSYCKPWEQFENNHFYEIRFLDSFAFMSSSLDALSRNLKDDQMHISKDFYNQFYIESEKTFKTMRNKGVYPYEYMDSFEKFKETKLPKKKCFRDKLNGSRCTKNNYLYAQKVWKEMKCQSLKDYTRIYMINDVLLLADVFENFRNLSLQVYELDPCWYYTIVLFQKIGIQ